jgi:hypothetical protein
MRAETTARVRDACGVPWPLNWVRRGSKRQKIYSLGPNWDTITTLKVFCFQ